eukprot:1903113-Amphidinium_carterae.2
MSIGGAVAEIQASTVLDRSLQMQHEHPHETDADRVNFNSSDSKIGNVILSCCCLYEYSAICAGSCVSCMHQWPVCFPFCQQFAWSVLFRVSWGATCVRVRACQVPTAQQISNPHRTVAVSRNTLLRSSNDGQRGGIYSTNRARAV